MASYAASMGFEPLQGKLKESYQSIKDKEGKLIKFVGISFSIEGCIDKITAYSKYNDKNYFLERHGNAFYSYENGIKVRVMELNDKCQIIKDNIKNAHFIYKDDLLVEIETAGVPSQQYAFNEKNELIKSKGTEPSEYELTYKYKRVDGKVNEIFIEAIFGNSNEKGFEKTICSNFDSNHNQSRCVVNQSINGVVTEKYYSFTNTYYDM